MLHEEALKIYGNERINALKEVRRLYSECVRSGLWSKVGSSETSNIRSLMSNIEYYLSGSGVACQIRGDLSNMLDGYGDLKRALWEAEDLVEFDIFRRAAGYICCNYVSELIYDIFKEDALSEFIDSKYVSLYNDIGSLDEYTVKRSDLEFIWLLCNDNKRYGKVPVLYVDYVTRCLKDVYDNISSNKDWCDDNKDLCWGLKQLGWDVCVYREDPTLDEVENNSNNENTGQQIDQNVGQGTKLDTQNIQQDIQEDKAEIKLAEGTGALGSLDSLAGGEVKQAIPTVESFTANNSVTPVEKTRIESSSNNVVENNINLTTVDIELHVIEHEVNKIKSILGITGGN